MRSIFVIALYLGLATGSTAGIVQVGYLDTDQTVWDMVLVGETAYLARGAAGLTIVDLSDPAAPVILDQFADEAVWGVAVVGDLVYLGGAGRLRILDATDLGAVTLVGEVSLGVSSKVAVQGGYAYVACGYLGLKIVDVGAPAHPVEVGRFDAPQDLHSIAVAVEGDHAYVTNSDLGGYPLFIIDVSDPTEPWMSGWFYTSSSAATAVRDGLTYTADWNFFITDVTESANPERTGTVLQIDARDVALVGDRAYLACYVTGLAIIDISDPAAPRTAGGFHTASSGLAVAADGDLVLLSNHDRGVWILTDDSATAAPTATPAAADPAMTAHPNPFNPHTILSLEIPHAGLASVVVHDLRGHQVRNLFEGDLSAGRHTLSWDGVDARGLSLPAGVYLAVLRTATGRAVARLNLVK